MSKAKSSFRKGGKKDLSSQDVKNLVKKEKSRQETIIDRIVDGKRKYKEFIAGSEKFRLLALLELYSMYNSIKSLQSTKYNLTWLFQTLEISPSTAYGQLKELEIYRERRGITGDEFVAECTKDIDAAYESFKASKISIKTQYGRMVDKDAVATYVDADLRDWENERDNRKATKAVEKQRLKQQTEEHREELQKSIRTLKKASQKKDLKAIDKIVAKLDKISLKVVNDIEPGAPFDTKPLTSDSYDKSKGFFGISASQSASEKSDGAAKGDGKSDAGNGDIEKMDTSSMKKDAAKPTKTAKKGKGGSSSNSSNSSSKKRGRPKKSKSVGDFEITDADDLVK